MARGINKVILLYESGQSIPQVAAETGLSRSKVRDILKEQGSLRSRSEGIRMAAQQGRLGSGFRGKQRQFTNEHKHSISKARADWGEKNAAGTRINSSGYIEFTRGENKGRLEHVVKMEQRIGRRLQSDECVHHIDGNKQNNDDNNLALMTVSGHSKLHRREETLQGIERKRQSNGTWS